MIFSLPEELRAAIHEPLAAILAETLQRVFEHWMERLEWVSQNNDGRYP
jgi:hypothetical protein